MSATDSHSIGQQLRRNAVAIISLVVALSSLGYNTWRNEATEANRNVRLAAFEILVKLGELQEVAFFAHFDRDATRGSPRRGWAYVLTLTDLAQVVPPPVPAAAESLRENWAENWQGLGNSESAWQSIDAATDALRQATRKVLLELD